ncbi:hypothetical protein HGO37_08045 [Rhizobium sp. CG4]|uniref:hypothetical protein n=1 Tax=Rhizobium sp. CG4 TaxID=2726075 RepID=UPI0020337023|nr:hypothetical protein [Rhizobium sp. CG4]MCM2455332.1 hypothetical protein [Rhizobium sp. CG4]
MTDRPILFSAPMVRALLNGTKSQTRRIIKPQPTAYGLVPLGDAVINAAEWQIRQSGHIRIAAGDRLWVRESWKPHSTFDHLSPRNMPESTVFYLADDKYSPSGSRGRPGIHMPRWASRLTLSVTDVRVERLQDISEADAVAEGAPLDPDHRDATQDDSNPHMVRVNAWTRISPVAWYHRLWNEINGPGSWDANPWVVAYTFTVHPHNIDELERKQGASDAKQ